MPTSMPTDRPTKMPTTSMPTDRPTKVPTSVPEDLLTFSPIGALTPPTKFPTRPPSKHPTGQPTMSSETQKDDGNNKLPYESEPNQTNDNYLNGKLRSSFYCGWSFDLVSKTCNLAKPCPTGLNSDCPAEQT